MVNRLRLHEILTSLDIKDAYFQPPETVKLSYPAITYSYTPTSGLYANNKIYQNLECYTLVLIEQKQNSNLIESLKKLRYVSHVRGYSSGNLWHNVFTIYI